MELREEDNNEIVYIIEEGYDYDCEHLTYGKSYKLIDQYHDGIYNNVIKDDQDNDFILDMDRIDMFESSYVWNQNKIIEDMGIEEGSILVFNENNEKNCDTDFIRYGESYIVRKVKNLHAHIFVYIDIMNRGSLTSGIPIPISEQLGSDIVITDFISEWEWRENQLNKII